MKQIALVFLFAATTSSLHAQPWQRALSRGFIRCCSPSAQKLQREPKWPTLALSGVGLIVATVAGYDVYEALCNSEQCPNVDSPAYLDPPVASDKEPGARRHN